MTHWSDAYLGLPYEPGRMDCAALVERVEREVFGRELHLPTERQPDPFWLSGTIERNRHLAERCESPAEGDGVLMRAGARLNHIGVYCVLNGTPHVLHAPQSARAVVRHALRDIGNYGLQVEGFYRWLKEASNA